jgi:small-conductance mechanosensitive channel
MTAGTSPASGLCFGWVGQSLRQLRCRRSFAPTPKLRHIPARPVVLQAIKDNSVVIAIRAWVSNQAYRDIYREQTLNLKAKIEAAGLRIPFPRTDAHIVPPVEKGGKEI